MAIKPFHLCDYCSKDLDYNNDVKLKLPEQEQEMFFCSKDCLYVWLKDVELNFASRGKNDGI